MQRMEAFGERYVYKEWKETLDTIFNASIPDDEDAIDLSTVDNGVPKPLKALEDAMVKHRVSFPAPSNRMSSILPVVSIVLLADLCHSAIGKCQAGICRQ